MPSSVEWLSDAAGFCGVAVGAKTEHGHRRELVVVNDHVYGAGIGLPPTRHRAAHRAV